MDVEVHSEGFIELEEFFFLEDLSFFQLVLRVHQSVDR